MIRRAFQRLRHYLFLAIMSWRSYFSEISSTLDGALGRGPQSHASKVLLADLQLLIASIGFGVGFAGQKEAMIEGVGPLTFNAMRYVASTIILAPIVIYITLNKKHHTKEDKSGKTSDSNLPTHIQTTPLQHTKHHLDARGHHNSNPTSSALQATTPSSSLLSVTGGGGVKTLCKHDCAHEESEFNETMKVWFYGFALALLNFSGSTFQQTGIQYTSSSESAFLTGFYIVFTPIVQVIFPRISPEARPKFNTWVAVGLAMLGLFVISDSSAAQLKLGYGELLTLVGTFFWTFHILLTDYATDRVDSLQLTLIQLLGTSALCFLASYNLEFAEWNSAHILASWKIIMFLGSIECVGFTFGALGQTHAPPHHAAVIYGSEVAWATIGGVIIVHELCSMKEFLGCVLMLASTACAKMEFEDLKKYIYRIFRSHE